MRDIAITLIFIGISVAAFRRPFYGALLWVLFGLMNPHRLAWGFAYSLPFAQAAVIVIILSAAYNKDSIRWPRSWPISLFLIFMAWMLLTTSTAMVSSSSWSKYVDVLKVTGMTLVVASLIRTREEIIGLVWVMVCSLGFFGFKGGIFTIMTGGSYRVWGPPSSLVSGNNELAVALVMIIPLIYFLVTNPAIAREFRPASRLPINLIKRGGVLAIILCAVSAIGSQSRGAFLAIAVMCIFLWWRSHSKAGIAVLALTGIFLALPLMPDSWFERMQTIQTYSEDLSALQRINAWETAANIAADRPLGAGFTTAHPAVFAAYSPRQGLEWIYVAHSIYFQVLGEHGYIGLILYLLFWTTVYTSASRIAKQAKRHTDLDWAAKLMNMCKVSLVGFAVGGAFLSLAYWDMPFYLMVVVVATGLLVRAHVDEAAKTTQIRSALNKNSPFSVQAGR